MKGYWHLPAVAAVISVVYVHSGVVSVLVLFVSLLTALFLYGRINSKHYTVTLLIMVFLCFYHLQPTDPPGETEETLGPETITGKIVSAVTFQPLKIEFLVDSPAFTHDILLINYEASEEKAYQLYKQFQPLKHGATCEFQITPLNSSKSKNPYEFDYGEYLNKQNIGRQFQVDLTKEPICHGSSFLQRFYVLRLQLIEKVHTTYSAHTASWISAIVFGEDAYIDKDVEGLFQEWGLSHIVAISGSNIGLITALLYTVLWRLNVFTKEYVAVILIVLLPVYAVLAGGEPSVWRATLMLIVILLLPFFRIRLSQIDLLSMLFLLFVLVNKQMLYHVGFQLSFLVTFFIILSLKWLRNSDSLLWQGAQLSFISQIAILPLQFHYFYYFQPLSIVVNILVIPYFTFFVIPFMYILAFLAILPAKLVLLFDLVYSFVHDFIIIFLQRFDNVFSAPLLADGFSLLEIALFYFLLIQMMARLEKGHLRQGFVYGVSVMVLVTVLAGKPYFSPEGKVTMLSIGQGDAIVIELPYREGVIMIDAAASFSYDEEELSDSNFKQVIKPFFRGNSIYGVDHLILTHGDIDHDGSAGFILEEFPVSSLHVSPFYPREKLVALAEIQQTKMRLLGQGDRLVVGDAVFQTLLPATDARDANRNSLVLYTVLGGKEWLFTGDADMANERDLLQAYPELDVDILKVGHHGSKTSTSEELLVKTTPEYAWISVGENNRYGHPDGEVIETLEEQGIHILRTDVDGAIEYRFKGGRGGIYTKEKRD